MLPVTTITAASVAVLYVLLALRIVYMRRTGAGPLLGLNDNEVFLRAVRAHANLGEYAPLFLIVLGLYEVQGGNHALLVTAACVFVGARVSHAVGVSLFGTSIWRTVGVVGTITTLLTVAAAAVLLLV